jgi:hypothetical protein
MVRKLKGPRARPSDPHLGTAPRTSGSGTSTIIDDEQVPGVVAPEALASHEQGHLSTRPSCGAAVPFEDNRLEPPIC